MSHPVDKSCGLCWDQVIQLNTKKAKRDYPQKLRRISLFDTNTRRFLVLLTNHFDLSALAIAAIYKRRWQVVLFFKNGSSKTCKLKLFWGTSENAVRAQLWVALCVYLLVAGLNKFHGINESISRILQILNDNVLQRVRFNPLLGEFPATT
jgi:hypothetical protein